MFIIDRYLLRQFLMNFVICFISLTGLYIVIDAFANLDNFVDYSKENGGLLSVVVEHYSYRAVTFFDRTSGILCLISAVFTVTWFQRHNEMTALMAAGISRWRVVTPIMAAVVIVSLLAAGNRELVMPKIRGELTRDANNLNSTAAVPLASRYDSETDILLDGVHVLPTTGRIEQPSFVMPAKLAAYGRQYSAQVAEYLPADGQRPAGYLLRGVTEPTALKSRASLALDDERVIYMPGDTTGLADDEVFVASRVSLDLLTSGSNWRDYASTGELVAELRNPSVDLGNDVRVALHRRLLQPFMDGTLLLLGLPLIISRDNRNPFIGIGLCLAIVAGFFVVSLGCQSLGVSGWLRPSLASWLPLILFVPLAAALTDSMRR
jgi:lipopolysaccharide export system permease protein